MRTHRLVLGFAVSLCMAAPAAAQLRDAAGDPAVSDPQREAAIAAQYTDLSAARAAWPALVEALDCALAGVAEALNSLDAPDAAPAPAAPRTLGAQERADLRAAIDVLADALAAGELPAEPLAALERHLSATSLDALREALDRFDFDDAVQRLHVLRHQTD